MSKPDIKTVLQAVADLPPEIRDIIDQGLADTIRLERAQELADRLITTLDATMPSDQADAIVRDVAEAIYRDLLAVPGQIVVDTSQPTGFVHGGFGKNGRKSVMHLAKYKYQPEAKE